MVTPVRPSPSVEEDTGDHQIKAATGLLGLVQRCQALCEMCQAIDSTGVKMPPTAVPRDIEVRIGLPDDADNVRYHFWELVGIIGKVLQSIPASQFQHLLATVSNGDW
jgi:hypothetical protein